MTDGVICVLPFSQRSRVASEFTSEEIAGLVARKISQIREVFGENFVVFTDSEDLSAECTRQDWPLLSRSKADEPEGTIAEALAFLGRSLPTSSVAWMSPFNPLFGPKAIRAMAEAWSNLEPVQKEAGLLAVAELQSYAFMNGRPLNFLPEDDVANSRDLVSLQVSSVSAIMFSSHVHHPRHTLVGKNTLLHPISQLEDFSLRRHEDLDLLSDFLK